MRLWERGFSPAALYKAPLSVAFARTAKGNKSREMPGCLRISPASGAQLAPGQLHWYTFCLWTPPRNPLHARVFAILAGVHECPKFRDTLWHPAKGAAMFEKNGKFWADWRDKKGKRHRQSFNTERAALKFEAEQKALAHPKKLAQAKPWPTSCATSSRAKGKNIVVLRPKA